MKKFLLCSAVFVFVSTHLQAQQRTVTGKVTSTEDGSALPGVSVLVKGTSIGSVTDIDGNYSVTLPEGSGTLVFSFIGLATKEVEVGSQSVIDVDMATDAKQLSEVIVVGYGTQRKEELTGSLNVIDGAQLEQIPTSTFQDALQGTSGLQVVSNDGAPGAGVSVRVRGIGSITASNEPLYVVDGIPVTSGSVSQTDFGNGGRSSNVLASLNPNDIENVVVLKDAASSAIYGSRGANGVVLITTKSGKSGKGKIDLKMQYGFSDFAFDNLLEPLNRDQYRQLYIEGYVNAGTLTEEEATDLYASQFPEDANTDWLDEISQTGTTSQYDLSFQGGSDKLTYFISGSYFDQEGVVIENKFERYSSRINLSANLTDKLKVTNNLSVSYFEQRGITDGTRWQAPFYLSYLMAPAVPVLDDQGRFYGEHTFFMGANNPVGHLNEDERELQQSRIIDNLSLSYQITEDLSFKSAWSIDILNVDEHIFANGRYGDGRNIGGSVNDATTDIVNWLGTQTLNYGKTFNDVHNVDALIGYEAQKVTTQVLEASGEGFSHPDLKTLSSAANPTAAIGTETEYAFNSYFSRLNYDYDGTYYLQLSLRSDGSSRFGPANRRGTFWSVGLGYTLSNAGFMQNVTVIDFLKFRASYGTVGNAGIGNFDWAGLWGFTREYDGQPGAAPSQVANENLTWESQENLNIGMDLNMLNNRIGIGLEYFNRTSSDLILDRPLSNTTGFRNVSQNVGDMENDGIELTLDGKIIETPDFYLSASFNITFLNNELTFLPEPIVDGTKRREEGRDFQEYYLYGWAGVDPTNGDPLWFTDSTKSETTNDVNEAERFYDGKSATPDFYGGFNLSAGYKGFSIGLQFNYQFGNYLYDAPGWVIHGDGRFTPRSTSTYAFENRWQNPGDEALFPQHRWGGNQASNTRNSSRYLFEGDFIRLKTLNIGYDLPSSIVSKLKLRSVKVYTNLNNFWTWVADDELYFDPEQTINGVYNTVTPINKTVSFGVNIGL
ncbi:MAG: TonB-dependent receptor [Bacteroidota bacterium]